MEPYKQLERVAGFHGLEADLSKRDGTTISLRVKSEELVDQRVESAYPGSVRVRAWSTDVASLTREDGTVVFPGDGDRLHVRCRDGKERAFLTTRESSSTRYWNWRYSTPGGRIVFYTKTEGLEIATEQS